MLWLDFLDLNPRRKEEQEMLFLLCKEGLAKAVIDEYVKHIKIVNRFVIGAILQTETGLNMIRRELKKVSPGIRVDTDEIQTILVGEVLKREIVTGELPDEARARVKKATRTPAKRKPKQAPKDPA